MEVFCRFLNLKISDQWNKIKRSWIQQQTPLQCHQQSESFFDQADYAASDISTLHCLHNKEADWEDIIHTDLRFQKYEPWMRLMTSFHLKPGDNYRLRPKPRIWREGGKDLGSIEQYFESRNAWLCFLLTRYDSSRFFSESWKRLMSIPFSSFLPVYIFARAKYLKFLLLIVILHWLCPSWRNTDPKKERRDRIAAVCGTQKQICVFSIPRDCNTLSFHCLNQIS